MTGDLYTAEEAAEEVGVSVGTVYSWVNRGYLTHAGRRGRHKLFRLADVFACEKTRQRKKRRRNTACYADLQDSGAQAEPCPPANPPAVTNH